MLVLIFFGSSPTPDVALACGSASTSKVLNSSTARAAARLMEVVVFPTPPFWFAIAIIFPMVLCVLLKFFTLSYSHKMYLLASLFKLLTYFSGIYFYNIEGVVMHANNVVALNKIACFNGIVGTHGKVISTGQHSEFKRGSGFANKLHIVG